MKVRGWIAVMVLSTAMFAQSAAAPDASKPTDHAECKRDKDSKMDCCKKDKDGNMTKEKDCCKKGKCDREKKEAEKKS